MKFKYTQKETSYTEEGQPNPIRWAICNKTENGFKNETNWLRCKDFFNDYCIAYNGGPKFRVYGFDTNDITFPPQGTPVYLAVTNLTKEFENNLDVFNEWLEEHSLPTLDHHLVEAGIQVLEIPPVFFSNTHHVSLITLIIRLLNTSHSFSSFQEVIEYKKFEAKDQLKWNQVVAFGKFFALPEQLKEFTWYCDAKNNSKTLAANAYNLSNLIHNNGCLSWITAMESEKL